MGKISLRSRSCPTDPLSTGQTDFLKTETDEEDEEDNVVLKPTVTFSKQKSPFKRFKSKVSKGTRKASMSAKSKIKGAISSEKIQKMIPKSSKKKTSTNVLSKMIPTLNDKSPKAVEGYEDDDDEENNIDTNTETVMNMIKEQSLHNSSLHEISQRFKREESSEEEESDEEYESFEKEEDSTDIDSQNKLEAIEYIDSQNKASGESFKKEGNYAGMEVFKKKGGGSIIGTRNKLEVIESQSVKKSSLHSISSSQNSSQNTHESENSRTERYLKSKHLRPPPTVKKNASEYSHGDIYHQTTAEVSNTSFVRKNTPKVRHNLSRGEVSNTSFVRKNTPKVRHNLSSAEFSNTSFVRKETPKVRHNLSRYVTQKETFDKEQDKITVQSVKNTGIVQRKKENPTREENTSLNRQRSEEEEYYQKLFNDQSMKNNDNSSSSSNDFATNIVAPKEDLRNQTKTELKTPNKGSKNHSRSKFGGLKKKMFAKKKNPSTNNVNTPEDFFSTRAIPDMALADDILSQGSWTNTNAANNEEVHRKKAHNQVKVDKKKSSNRKLQKIHNQEPKKNKNQLTYNVEDIRLQPDLEMRDESSSRSGTVESRRQKSRDTPPERDYKAQQSSKSLFHDVDDISDTQSKRTNNTKSSKSIFHDIIDSSSSDDHDEPEKSVNRSQFFVNCSEDDVDRSYETAESSGSASRSIFDSVTLYTNVDVSDDVKDDVNDDASAHSHLSVNLVKNSCMTLKFSLPNMMNKMCMIPKKADDTPSEENTTKKKGSSRRKVPPLPISV